MGYISEEGYNKLVAQLRELEAVERPKIIEAIREARDKGDLSENAEYDAAKEAQGMLEMKISQLKDILANVRIIDESKMQTDTVQMLNKVELLNLKNNQKVTYTIVSETESNLREGKIAASTPIAKALLGKAKGEKVSVKVPAGVLEFEILNISL